MFYKVLDTANLASLTEKDLIRYESDLKNYMDTKSCIKFAENRGREEGRAEGRAEVAKVLKEKNMPLEVIMECTGFSREQIEQL